VGQVSVSECSFLGRRQIQGRSVPAPGGSRQGGEVLTPAESFVELAGAKIEMSKAGTGRSLLVLHHDIGNPGWLPFYDDLARDFTVHVPSHPGFGKSERLDWMRTVRDMAIFYNWFIEHLGLESLVTVGLGFGGWIAAEMGMMCHHDSSRLVLAGAMGIQPSKGEILDQFLISTIDYVKAGFVDEKNYVDLYTGEPSVDQLEQWEINREMTSRVAFKPYMFDQTMPHLIRGLSTPTLIVWGREDRVVPLVCGEQYRDAIPKARLETLAGCGHSIEVEKPAELARLVRDFAGRA
jgi:pimeloyl-ACP methyl ester carboxylesterase